MKNRNLSVFILAAGLGTRLNPLTQQMPKPLVPIVDQTILGHQRQLVQTLGNVPVHINAHHLANQVETAALQLGFERVWKEFPEILGTGGPLHRFYKEGGRGDLLVLNSDCYCKFDLEKFICNAENSGADVALLAVDFAPVNTLVVNENGFLSGVKNYCGEERGLSLTFSGVSWYSERALREIRESEKNAVHFWKREIERGNLPWVDMSQKDSLWIDMGTPQGLWNATCARLDELGLDSWIHPEHPLAASGWIKHSSRSVVQKNVQVNASVRLKNVLLLDGANVSERELQNEIRGTGFSWEIQG
ncbi:MAG: NTP transferase domain-containing protein [Fibrobacter sp.]|jgi:NDP-sugar pyrophosphorylase family protein|nr:NTP transferase domain-containing protein [Fibrobacter sp.]